MLLYLIQRDIYILLHTLNIYILTLTPVSNWLDKCIKFHQKHLIDYSASSLHLTYGRYREDSFIYLKSCLKRQSQHHTVKQHRRRSFGSTGLCYCYPISSLKIYILLFLTHISPQVILQSSPYNLFETTFHFVNFRYFNSFAMKENVCFGVGAKDKKLCEGTGVLYD